MAKRTPKAKRATRKPAAEGATPAADSHPTVPEAIPDLNVKQRANDRYSPAQVIAALEISAGINSAAGARLGCSGSTIAHYVDRYPEIAAAKAQIENDRLDLAESVVIRHMQSEKQAFSQLDAAKYYLKTKGKVRGYVESRELSARWWAIA